MKHTLLTLCILTGLWAEDTALFAKVTGVAQNDTLSIRSEASYKSKKVGSLPPEAYIAIEKCKDTGNSKWCSIDQIPQLFYENFHMGWVNARYLKFSNRGYVTILGEKNDCYYALGCRDNKCSVVKSFDYDYEVDTLSNLFVEQIGREKLEGTNHFGAMNEDGDGFCTSGNMIESHFKKLNLTRLSSTHSEPSYKRVMTLVEDLRGWIDGDKLSKYIHPNKGVILTWNVLFGGQEDMHFSYAQVKNIEKERNRKILWGQTYGKGDDVWMSLYDHMGLLTRPIRDISRVEKLKDLKRFKSSKDTNQIGYEVLWVNENSDTKEYDYLGLVVILESYMGKWYVVGMLRDRWTI